MGFEGLDEWVVSWGRGPAPSTWHVLAQGSASDSTEIERMWTQRDLSMEHTRCACAPEGERVGLMIACDSFCSETLTKSLPFALRANCAQVVGGKWSSGKRCANDLGISCLERDGTIIHEERLAPALKQRVVLPDGLPAATYAVQVYPGFERDGGGGQRLEGIDLQSTSVERWPVQQASVLPSGYLLPDAVDVNGDGIAELVQMSYGRQSTL